MASFRFVASFLVAAACLPACKQRADESTSAVKADEQAWDFPEPQVTIPINQSFGAGQKFEVPVDQNRQIEQVTITWDVDYTIVEKDAAGQPLLNDEGKPRYADGLYAFGFIVQANDSRQEIAAKKFVDADETDNWHDLRQIRGPRLQVEFWHAPKYTNDATVKAANRKVKVGKIIVRYLDAPGQIFQDFVYNPNDNVSMSPAAIALAPGESHRVVVPPARKIYRVDVRWGDEKPRIDGVYVPGTASGQLRINGIEQGPFRNVAAVETQVWTGLVLPPSSDESTNVDVAFVGDRARVHWVRVYYVP